MDLGLLGTGAQPRPATAPDGVLGGWSLGAVYAYSSGTPLSIGTTISSYEGWRAPFRERFDPFRDRSINPNAFPAQPTDRLGNMTRFNPDFRFLANLNENISLQKRFNIAGDRVYAQLRGEAFNLFNRTQWGPAGGAQTIQNPNFGLSQNQINTPRRLQIALKLYFLSLTQHPSQGPGRKPGAFFS